MVGSPNSGPIQSSSDLFNAMIADGSGELCLLANDQSLGLL